MRTPALASQHFIHQQSAPNWRPVPEPSRINALQDFSYLPASTNVKQARGLETANLLLNSP
ncbi:MAG: hypothetical protein CMM00_07395 [Rhodopirellula sp.]|nr:hypothetical protein [Rhodopirellula sp.]